MPGCYAQSDHVLLRQGQHHKHNDLIMELLRSRLILEHVLNHWIAYCQD
jgi:hypothetical protein